MPKINRFAALRIIFLLSILCVIQAHGQFITTWKTDNLSFGSSNNDQVSIPVTGIGYNYTIDWGDSNMDTGVTGAITHTYATPGTYTITITGAFPRIYFNNTGDKAKILTVEQWGTNAWTSMSHAFHGCSNLTLPAGDAPDLSGVTDMSYMFFSATSFNNDINSWDVSNVVDMSFMFRSAAALDQPFTTWDVSSVTNMWGMFNSAQSFNGDISNWNVSGVTNMREMFNNTLAFNQDLSSWDVSNVTDMQSMFNTAVVFNGNITTWNVSGVTDMGFMFNGATVFNQDIGGWQVGSVTNMRGMFQVAPAFNQDIGGWAVGSVTDMDDMFFNATAFNQNIGGWNVSSVMFMRDMFKKATAFNQPIGSWDVSAVTSMTGMFENAINFNQIIGGWQVGNVFDMGDMFNGATSFNQDISSWDVSNVITTFNMFKNASSFNQNIGGWNLSSLITATSMFEGASSFNQDISGWNVASVISMISMFQFASSFDQNIGGWNTSNVTSMQDMFYGATIFNQDISSWDVSNVRDMSGMFLNATFFNQSLGNWDVSLVNNMQNMLTFTALTTARYDATLIGWDTLPSLLNNVIFDAFGLAYCTAAAARANLISTHNWTITDFGLSCQDISLFVGSDNTGIPVVNAQPFPVNLGSSSKGTDLTQVFAIVNTGTMDLNITSITLDNSNYSISGAINLVPPGSTQTFSVTLSGTIPGSFNTTVTIVNDDANDNPYLLPLTGAITAPPGMNLLSTNPIRQAFNISRNANITLSFDQNVDGTTVNSTTIVVYGDQTGLINGTFSGGGTPIVTFNPVADFKAGETIRVSITTSITSSGGSTLSKAENMEFRSAANAPLNIPPFFQERIILDSTEPASVDYLSAADIDGDSDLDILAAMNSPNELFWFRNDGSQNFTKILVATSLGTTGTHRSASIGDIDKDGDMDLTNTYSGRLDWYSNDGMENFTQIFLNQTGVGVGNPESIILDIDTDGDMDIASAWSSSLFPDRVFWLENNGSQNFVRKDIVVQDAGISDLHVTDLDKDGDVDLLSGGGDVQGVKIMRWYENDGSQGFTERILNTSFISGIKRLYPADFNNDGAMDIVASTSGAVNWYKNDGLQNFTEIPITSSSNLKDLVAADLDVDGDMDIIGVGDINASGSDFLYLYENDGSGSFTERVYPTSVSEWSYLLIEDLDQDGDLDILGSGRGFSGSKLVWFENTTSTSCSNPPTANAGPDGTICESASASLSGTIGGGASSSTWTTSGDGTFDNSALVNATYTPGTNDISNGTVTLTLSSDDVPGCGTATDTMVLSIETAPTANAGADQALCPADMASLTGVIGGSATSATWFTSGDGNFDNPALLNAVYTPGSSDLSTGIVTLTITTDPVIACTAANDALVLTIGGQIQVVQQTAAVDVSQSVSIDPANGASFNPADVLLTTLITSPTKGTAVINPDQTITYTANASTVGNDTFQFQICNQCNLCSTANANITINNVPPSIQPPVINTTAGETITVDLNSAISDINGNLDLSSLMIIVPPKSGAIAFINAPGILMIDYTGVIFIGTDDLTIEVCDTDGLCTQTILSIEVAPQQIKVFNALSPNGDGKHDIFEIENIQFFPQNQVKIFNRWGDTVFETNGYDNQSNFFEGRANKGGKGDLPAGTYYYSINLGNGDPEKTGFLTLRK